MFLFTRSLAVIGAVSLFVCTESALAQTGQAQVCYTDSIPVMMTGWNDTFTVSKFDPDLGVLKSVEFSLSATIEGDTQFESLDLLPTIVTTNFGGTVTVSRPMGGGAILSVAPSQSFVTNVTAYDGNTDFGGTSGMSFPNLAATDMSTAIAPPPISDLALFTGPAGMPGDIVLDVSAIGTSTGSGAGNLIQQFMQMAGADIEVCYNYNLDCDGDGISDLDEIAMGSLDCNMDSIPDECQLDLDCNMNGVPDDCDIASMSSADCNMNDIPDDCEEDCNSNMVPDDCDITAGTSMDANMNGVPDDCEIDCNGNMVPDDIDISSGTSMDCNGNMMPDECDMGTDCNGNMVLDECDISSMTSLDCDMDGVPDDCEPDCNMNMVADDCDISGGTSMDADMDGIPDDCEEDCNGNMIPDDFDISSGTSTDLNMNDIPDDCEPDCNVNMVPDDIDISSGTSLDCNADGIPDDCQVTSGFDCNFNGIPDDCDTTSSSPSPDLNMNGIPDECETSEDKCNGDGGDQMGCTDCPCMNNAPVGTKGGCMNSEGRSARIMMTGFPSVSNDTVTMRVLGGTSNSFGVLFSSSAALPINPMNPCTGLDSGVPTPLFDGLRCLGGTVRRHPTRMSDTNGDFGVINAPWGPPSGPPQGLLARGMWQAGSTICWQVIYREDDMAGCGTGIATTNAVRVVVTP